MAEYTTQYLDYIMRAMDEDSLSASFYTHELETGGWAWIRCKAFCTGAETSVMTFITGYCRT